MNKNKTSGIYRILNTTNNKSYIGSSGSVYYRWGQQHLKDLRKSQHYNTHLQHAWNKYGEQSFEFSVIEECAETLLAEREGFWIEHHKSWDRAYGYNLTRFAEGRMVISEETRQRKREVAWKHELPWDRFQEKVLEMFGQGMSKNEIANKLKSNRCAVYTCLEINGLYKNEGKGSIIKLTAVKRKEILDLRDKGLTWENILKQTGIGRTQLYRAMKCSDNRWVGTTKRTAYKVMTPELKSRAIELRSQGKSWKEIAAELSVKRQIFYAHDFAKDQPNMVRKKWTQEDHAEARRLLSEGLSLKKVAAQLGFDRHTLKNHGISKEVK